MNKHDKYIQQKLSEHDTELPASVKNKIEKSLAELPEKEVSLKSAHYFRRFTAAAAVFIFVTLFLLPNVSEVYAKTMEQVPIIGDIVKVVTIKNYYSDEKHEMDVRIPKLESEDNEAFDFINAEVEESSEILVQRFYKDLEDIGDMAHSSLYLDYEVVTNTDSWFTLQLLVHEDTGSGNTYYKYYHLNKLTGDIVTLGDIVKDDTFYDTVEEEIKEQMKEEMKQNSNSVYWVENSTFGDDCVSLTPEHNFYWNENNDLVIPFDKYEVAPGSMGTPEFVVSKDFIKDLVKPEFQDILF